MGPCDISPYVSNVGLWKKKLMEIQKNLKLKYMVSLYFLVKMSWSLELSIAYENKKMKTR